MHTASTRARPRTSNSLICGDSGGIARPRRPGGIGTVVNSGPDDQARQIVALLLAGAACHKATALPRRLSRCQVTALRGRAIYREWSGAWMDSSTLTSNASGGYVRKQVYRRTFVAQGELLFLIDPRNYKQ